MWTTSTRLVDDGLMIGSTTPENVCLVLFAQMTNRAYDTAFAHICAPLSIRDNKLPNSPKLAKILMKTLGKVCYNIVQESTGKYSIASQCLVPINLHNHWHPPAASVSQAIYSEIIRK